VLQRAQQGDADAADELARSCQRHAFLFALHLLGNRDDAMDIAQEAMLRFFGSLRRFDCSRPVRPWLLRIVHNLVRDRARRQRARPRTEPLEKSADAPVIDPVDPGPDPETLTARREQQLLVWRALIDLSNDHREVVALRDYLDLKYDEIASILGVPRGTVMSRLHRARKALQQQVHHQLQQTQAGEESDA